MLNLHQTNCDFILFNIMGVSYHLIKKTFNIFFLKQKNIGMLKILKCYNIVIFYTIIH